MVHVFLDQDETQVTEIKNINDINDLEEIMKLCKRNMTLPANFDEQNYGFKTKAQQILLAEIGDIVKTKKGAQNIEDFLQDKDYYDNNISADTLILRNLLDEAKESLQEV